MKTRIIQIVIGLTWLVAVITSGMLVYQHIHGAALPGCGPTSACAGLSKGDFGSLLSVPVSMLGFAYFVGLLFAWPKDNSARAMVAIGACVSLFYLGVMLINAKWCPYCVVVHVANLLMTAAVFLTRKTRESQTEPPVEKNASSNEKANVGSGNTATAGEWFRLAAGVIAITLVLTSVDRYHQRSVAADQLARAEASSDNVIKALDAENDTNNENHNAVKTSSFAGRHGRGADPAAARLVIFFDYQCGDCRKLESEIRQRLSQNNSSKDSPTNSLNDSIHVSVRQFPLCDDCNPEVHYPWFHPLACRAAYIAEAAASLAGEEGFWIANDWLFENKAKFTEAELGELATQLKVDVDELIRVSESESVKQIVAADVSEGISLGVSSTPFVFLNGIAIEGVSGDPANLIVALDRLSAELNRRESEGNPVPLVAVGSDRRPPEASDRMVRLWTESEPVKSLPDLSACRFVMGNPDGKHRVILFQEPTFADAAAMWQTLENLAKQRDDTRIEFYVHPMNPTMNDSLADWQKKLYPNSALATRMLVAVQESSNSDDVALTVEWLAKADWSKEESKLVKEMIDNMARSDGPIRKVESFGKLIHGDAVTAAIESDLESSQVRRGLLGTNFDHQRKAFAKRQYLGRNDWPDFGSMKWAWRAWNLAMSVNLFCRRRVHAGVSMLSRFLLR